MHMHTNVALCETQRGFFKMPVVLSFRNELRCVFCSSVYCNADTPTTYCIRYPLHTDVGEVIAQERRHKETRGINCSLS
jgi:hypothetical protein